MNVGYIHREFPNRLKITRRNRGFQQQQIWQMLGHKNNKLVSAWENERAMPNGTNLMKLCMLYNKTLKELYPDYWERVYTELLQ